MSDNKKFDDFNAIKVELTGSNLIEASAGTGKTYSIAILMLRLILEKHLQVKEVLMVTFTKAAVAELEERIRLFIRGAYKYSRGEVVEDGSIRLIVDKATVVLGIEEVERLLNNAVLFLDETSVLTIHSFSQQTLTQFAFETRQLFGAETLQNTNSILENEVNKFWRKEVTTLPAELLNYLIEAKLSRIGIKAVVSEHLSGKHYMPYDSEKDYSLCEDDHISILKKLSDLKETEAQLRSCLIGHIETIGEDLSQRIAANSYARKALTHLQHDPANFLDSLISKRKSGYVQTLFPDILEKYDECDEKLKERNEEIRRIKSSFNCLAIRLIESGLKHCKLLNNQMSFDDMIVNLHEAVAIRKQDSLIKGLREKYKAVFIDEFQDTDDLQYEIFQTIFKEETILFYIGDPKQSIYAWRKADIETYFKAYNEVGKRYSMNKNYRSSEAFIEAMNVFFKPVEDFDTFYFKGSENRIEYIDIESPEENKKGTLLKTNSADVPITIIEQPNKGEILNSLIAQVIGLLDGNTYFIDKAGKTRVVRPSDIGILVRRNGEGKDIKKSLSNYNIPAVTIGDSKVLESDEALDLLYVMTAMQEISLSTINRALLSSFTGYSINDLLLLDEEKTLEMFTSYKKRWDTDGIYAALLDFIADFNVRQTLLNGMVENGERIVTNLYQLTELFHKVQSSKLLNPLELLSWIKRGIDGMETEGDEFLQRVENDEEAVKIVTIHKSKGLEYNIVLAPYLDFTFYDKWEFYSFKHPGRGKYVSAEMQELSDAEKEMVIYQNEQENRRLLYVTITRAVYKCYIFRNTGSKNSTLGYFTQALKGSASPLLKTENALIVPEGFMYRNNMSIMRTPAVARKVNFMLSEQNWTRTSYSRLSGPHTRSVRSISNNPEDPYDRFMFTTLPKGVNTGNMLHLLFESINFTDNSKWQDKIVSAISRFAPKSADTFSQMLLRMLVHVLRTKIKFGDTSFFLSDVSFNKRIHEFEFDFTFPLFNPHQLKRLSTESRSIDVNAPGSLEGVMNGKIDLFFEHNGKYYVLDWKSNFLGDSLKDYSEEKMAVSMNENNYHLQYLLYTLAVKKYLKSRKPDFDYENDFGGVIYMFLRGIRQESSNGIYLRKPSLDTISELESILSPPLHDH